MSAPSSRRMRFASFLNPVTRQVKVNPNRSLRRLAGIPDERSMHSQFVHARRTLKPSFLPLSGIVGWKYVIPTKDDVEIKEQPKRTCWSALRDLAVFPLVFGIGALVCLIPVLMQINAGLEHTPLAATLTSLKFYCVMCATIAVAAPFVVDLGLDVLTTPNVFIDITRLIALMNLIAPSVIFLNRATLPNFEMLFVCLKYWQSINWIGIGLCQLLKDCPSVFSVGFLYLIGAVGVLGIYCDLFGIVTGDANTRIVAQIAFLCLYTLMVVCVILFMRYFYHKYKEGMRTMGIRALLNTLSQGDFSSVTFLFGACAAGTGLLLSPLVINRNLYYTEDYNADYIVAFYFFLSVYVMIIELLPSRLAKMDALKLQSNLDMKRSFVQYVSHEIRTPLNTVFLGLDLVEKHLNHGTDIAAIIPFVHDLRESCCVATEILNDLLNYEKLSSGIMKLELTDMYPVPYICRTLQPMLAQAAQKPVTISILEQHTFASDVPSELRNWKMRVDETKMAQVLRNFVSNAIKFTPAGGTICIECRLVKHSSGAHSLRFDCRDSGHGISKENQKKVFNEIVQFNANTQQGGGGSGLGLWITKKILELHVGRVGLESEGEGKGCLFFFEVPLIAAGSADTEDYAAIGQKLSVCHRLSVHDPCPPVPEHTETKESRPTAPMNLLLVDDSALNQKMMNKSLVLLGHTVTEASDGREALGECLRSMAGGVAAFDAIVMDNQMPNMNGMDAACAMRDAGYVGFIIGVTGDGDEACVSNYLAHGADALLVKPVSIQAFTETLERLISMREKSRTELLIGKADEEQSAKKNVSVGKDDKGASVTVGITVKHGDCAIEVRDVNDSDTLY